jgi:acyl-CoA dehydrogenase
VDLQKRLTAFMEEHIYPAEAVYHHEVAENRKAGNPWQPTKVMEQPRPRPRRPACGTCSCPSRNTARA